MAQASVPNAIAHSWQRTYSYDYRHQIFESAVPYHYGLSDSVPLRAGEKAAQKIDYANSDIRHIAGSARAFAF